MDPKQRVVADTGRTYPYMAFKQNGKWDQDWIEINPGRECLNEGVHWGDINNDGLGKHRLSYCTQDITDMS
jgi:hypothetical protein